MKHPSHRDHCLTAEHDGAFLADGFGAQYTGKMSALAFASFRNWSYCHRPFSEIGHNASAAECEAATGLALLHNARSREDCSSCTRCMRNRNCWEEVQKAISAGGSFADIFSGPVLANLREAYFSARTRTRPGAPSLLRQPDGRTSIAVHIRRGDVDWRSRARFVKEQTFVTLMDALASWSTWSLPPHFHIVSEGVPSAFPLLAARKDTTLHLNAPMLDSFHALVTADALVFGRSSFANAAAYLRGGAGKSPRVYYLPGDGWGFTKNLKGWHKCDVKSHGATCAALKG